jgi:hypothetical protein
MANPHQRLYPNLRRGAVAVKNSGKTAKAQRGLSFRKGASGNPRGRCKGAQNKVTREVQALAQGIIEDPAVQAKLLEQARRGKLAPAVMTLLFHYAYGKPKETVALEGGLEVLTIRIVDEYADPDDARGSDPAAPRHRASGQDIPTVAMNR